MSPTAENSSRIRDVACWTFPNWVKGSDECHVCDKTVQRSVAQRQIRQTASFSVRRQRYIRACGVCGVCVSTPYQTASHGRIDCSHGSCYFDSHKTTSDIINSRTPFIHTRLHNISTHPNNTRHIFPHISSKNCQRVTRCTRTVTVCYGEVTDAAGPDMLSRLGRPGVPVAAADFLGGWRFGLPRVTSTGIMTPVPRSSSCICSI